MNTDPAPMTLRQASLHATLARVRLVRRARRGRPAVVALAVLVAGGLFFGRPAQGPKLLPDVGQRFERVPTRPLAAREKLITRAMPELRVATDHSLAAAAVVRPPPGLIVLRMDSGELRRLLAAHGMFCLQIGTKDAVVLPLALP
jgi:hypothetical protein